MSELSKEELIDSIKHLISVDGSVTDINPNFLEYFELDELVAMKDDLENKKKNIDSISNDYLDEIFNKCS